MENELDIVQYPIAKLQPYENNAKIHTPAQIEHIANSIRAYGFNDPVGVWTNPEGAVEIVTGHGAVEAAKSVGLTSVPVTFLDHLTDEQRREYCHIHNQTQLETSFDYSALVEDMDNLSCNWEDFGFEGFCFDPENYGTDFSLSDADAPQFKSITLNVTQEQFDTITAVMESVTPREDGGNDSGNRIHEVCLQWAER